MNKIITRKKERLESLDFLRLISIFFVVCIHYVGWGGIASADNTSIINFAFSGGIAVACNCAVNCFYLISGYFITGNESIAHIKKRILKVWVPTFIYSITIPILLSILGYIELSVKEIIILFLPIMGNQYWFSTCFIAVTLLLPFIAPALTRMDDNLLRKLVGVLVFLDCIQPILGYNAFSNIGYGLLHAVTMYVIGYFIKRKVIYIKSLYCIAVFIFCVLLIGIITILSIKFGGDRNRTIADYNSILMVIQSIAFFCFFTNLNIKKFRFSKIAPYIFGVYLLNDNQYARDFLWQKVFHCGDFYESLWLPVHFFGATIIFVVVALEIEWIRINSWKYIKKIVRK